MRRLLLASTLLCPFAAWGQVQPGGIGAPVATPASIGAVGPVVNGSANNAPNGGWGASANCTISAVSSSISCTGWQGSAPSVGYDYYLQGTGTAGASQTGSITSASLSGTTLSAGLSAATVDPAPTWAIYNPAQGPLTLGNAGTGCSASETITLSGTGVGATVSITGSAGSVTGFTLLTNGAYTAYPGTTYTEQSTTGSCAGVTFKGTGSQVAGRFLTFQDYTTPITNGVASAVTAGDRFYLPSGCYGLFSQATSIAGVNVAITGDGTSNYAWPPCQSGTWIMPFSQTYSPFTFTGGIKWDGVGFYWPLQDGTTGAAIAYPPAITLAGKADYRFNDLRMFNCYDGFYVPTNGSMSRFYITNSAMFCPDKYFNVLNGFADKVDISGTNYFGPGTADNDMTTGQGGTVLGALAASSGELFHLDMSNGTNQVAAGLNMSNVFLQNSRYGFRMVGTAGTLNVSSLLDMKMDAVQTALSVEGSAAVTLLPISFAEMYSQDLFDASQHNPVIYLNGAAASSQLIIRPGVFNYAQGNVIENHGSLTNFVMTGNHLYAWGRSATTGTYEAYDDASANSGTELFSDNLFDCFKNAGGNTFYGIITGTNGVSGSSVKLTGDTIKNCNIPWNPQGSNGEQSINAVTLVGNSGKLTDSMTSTGRVTYGSNTFDNVPSTRVPTISCNGTAATATAGSSNQLATFVAPVGATSCTETWAGTLAHAPLGCGVFSSSVAIEASPGVSSTTTLTIALSLSTGSETITVMCPAS